MATSRNGEYVNKLHLRRGNRPACGKGLGWTIMRKAEEFDLSKSMCVALVWTESGFQNVFGHDRGKPFAGAGKVTKEKYLKYKRQRTPQRQQGVGVTQLTSASFQDRADELGGCWTMKAQVHVAFELLARLIKKYGLRRGLAAYNGGETGWRNGLDYADKIIARAKQVHEELVG